MKKKKKKKKKEKMTDLHSYRLIQVYRMEITTILR